MVQKVLKNNIPDNINMPQRHFYLVEEAGTGDLLIVERIIVTHRQQREGDVVILPLEIKKTHTVRIFKLRWEDGFNPTMWQEVTSTCVFGTDQALLLTLGDSMFVPTTALDHHAQNFYKPNCIYFAEYCVPPKPKAEYCGCSEPLVMVYDFENQRMQQPPATFKFNPPSSTDSAQLVVKSDKHCRWFRFKAM